MTSTVEVSEIPSRWAELLASAEAGSEVIVTEGNVPKARLTPLVRPRVLGLHPGAIEISEEFDAPLPDEFWMGTQ